MRKRTICFIVCFHENEWIIVDVAVEMDVWSGQTRISYNGRIDIFKKK